MPRFVVLRHETIAGSARPLHWDFMVEVDDTLWTWALAEEPVEGREIAAERLPDHRLAYLDYEGPISENRGSVTRSDRGECTIEKAAADGIRLVVRGEMLRGEIEIRATPGGAQNATFRWHRPVLGS